MTLTVKTRRLLLGETHRWRREGSGMRMARGQVRTLLADNTGKVFRRMGEGRGRAGTGDARGDTDEKARSRKATEGICRKVILILTSCLSHMRHRRRVNEREQHQDEIERVHCQRTIMLRLLSSDKRGRLNGSNVL